MKKIIVSLFAAVLVFSGVLWGVAVSASSNEGQNGSYDYDTGSYTLNGVTQGKLTALAKKKKPKYGGGRFEHSLSTYRNAASYYHPTKYHSATVKSAMTTVKSTQKKNITASASCKPALFGNRSFWATY